MEQSPEEIPDTSTYRTSCANAQLPLDWHTRFAHSSSSLQPVPASIAMPTHMCVSRSHVKFGWQSCGLLQAMSGGRGKPHPDIRAAICESSQRELLGLPRLGIEGINERHNAAG